MTKDQVSEALKGWGVSKAFRLQRALGDDLPVWEVATRRPAVVVDGWIRGARITVSAGFFLVWTSSKQKAKAIASGYGLRVRLLDGEALLWVPGAVADEILPRFGAKVKRVASEAQKAALASGRQNSPIFKTAQG